tara:strand:- start:517 stop:831 length:315 start_codon:yes stop_codon:yes gene_type:complete
VTLILPVWIVVLGAVPEVIVLEPEHQKESPFSKGIPSGKLNVLFVVFGQGTLTRTSSEPKDEDVPLAQRTQLMFEPSMLSTMIDFRTQGPPATLVLIVAVQSSE